MELCKQKDLGDDKIEKLLGFYDHYINGKMSRVKFKTSVQYMFIQTFEDQLDIYPLVFVDTLSTSLIISLEGFGCIS